MDPERLAASKETFKDMEEQRISFFNHILRYGITSVFPVVQRLTELFAVKVNQFTVDLLALLNGVNTPCLMPSACISQVTQLLNAFAFIFLCFWHDYHCLQQTTLNLTQ